MALQMRGVIEADFYYFRSGAGIVSKTHTGSPISFSATYDQAARKYYTKFDFQNIVSSLSFFLYKSLRDCSS